MKYLTILLSLFLISCTDADKLSYQTLGSNFSVECYSGGSLIYQGETTGQHSSSTGGTFVFKDNRTKKGIEITANCIFIQEN